MTSCSREPYEVVVSDKTIKLEWYENYEGETRNNVDIGFLWTLSFLGADLRLNDYSQAAVWKSERVLEFDVSKAKFESFAENHLSDLMSALKRSEEYQRNGSIDIGRFVSLLLISPKHYYSITGVPEKLKDFLMEQNRGSKVGLTESSVSKADRLVLLPDTLRSVVSAKFVAVEGSFESSGEFQPKEFEVYNIMKNGNLRFAIYDLDSIRIDFADSAFSLGGKPSKCIWCHEGKLLPSFVPHEPPVGYASMQQLNYEIAIWQNKLSEYRLDRHVAIDFSELWDHTYSELLYLGFLEPSAKRLSMEWRTSISHVEQTLKDEPIHDNHEFSFIKQRYSRRDVLKHEPFESIRVSELSRETGGFEPNLLDN